MRRLFAVALATFLPFAMPAFAATQNILPMNETTVKVVKDLGALGLGANTLGSASVSFDNTSPILAFDITGGEIEMNGDAWIQHEGSGFELFSLADPSVNVTAESLVVDTAQGAVFGNVNGAGTLTRLFDFGGSVANEGIILNVSVDLGTLLTALFNAPDLSGMMFAFGNTAPVTGPAMPPVAPVPLPAGAPLLMLGLGGLVVLRRRKAA